MSSVIIALKTEYDSIVAGLGTTIVGENVTAALQRMTEICNEIQCEENPELRGKICPCCNEKFNGHGNNPWPLPYNRVCDTCNAMYVIPARLRK